jgi:uncharacterized protein YheU (UPF0270 family)
VDVDFRLLKSETLRAVVEEFVLRDGTDYGEREASLDVKVAHVMRGLETGRVKVIFDPETESCDLKEVSQSEVRKASPGAVGPEA